VYLTPAGLDVNLTVSITPELPSYWSGSIDFDLMPDSEGQNFQSHFLPIYHAFSVNEPLRGGVNGCPEHGTCRALVHAPALAVDRCVSKVIYVNFTELLSFKQAKEFEKGCHM
jgi:hypothetical protein